MPKQTITMTRDLFDEIIEATATKERERILELLNNYKTLKPAGGTHEYAINLAIALINGEHNG